MTFWLLGSLAATNAGDLVPLLGPVALGTLVLLALRWRMNVLSLPEEEARALGAPDRPPARRRRRGRDPRDRRERRRRRHHRLGRPGRAPPRPLPGRARFRPADADRRHPRRRLPAPHRHARAHDGAGGGPARHPHRARRHALLHRLLANAATAGREPSSARPRVRLPRPRRRARHRPGARRRRGAGPARPERRRQDHPPQDPARPACRRTRAR